MEADIQIRDPRFPRKIPGLIPVGLVVLLVACIATLFLSWRIELPKNTFIFGTFHSGEHLSDPLPRLWQNTATTSKFPFMAGVAKTNDGWKPYTITLRGFGNAGSWTRGTGPFVIHADSPLEIEKNNRVFLFISSLWKLGSHAAYISLRGENLDPSLTGSLEGVVDGSTWKTNVRVTQYATSDLPAGDIAVDLVALPESWSFFRDALHANGITLDQTPETLSWTESEGLLPSVAVTFGNDAPATSTVLAFAAAAGQYDIESVQLEDGTVSEDLRLPLHLLTSPTSTWSWTPTTGTLIRLDDHSARIENGAPPTILPHVCPGRSIARLNAGALSRLTQLPLDESITALELSVENDHVIICWK